MSVASATPPDADTPASRSRLAGVFWRWRSLRIGALLAGPLGWLGIVYLGSLVVLLIASFWSLDEFSGEIVKGFSLDNFQTIVDQPVYLRIVWRTLSIAALVTVTDIVLAFPIAFYMARVARGATKGLLVVAVLMPLWASYLVKVYSWRTMFAHDGIINWFLDPVGLQAPSSGYVRVWIVMSYLWLPYMIMPLYAGLERIPDSLLDASGDLGARPWRTFRSVVVPLALPAIVAGSIFTFSLTLGDYITPQLVSNTQFIGNVVYANVGIANNLPLAAAFATVPVLIMMVYLLIARRLGAFKAL
jgi:putative spermidine/putrescine transport system permease protein